MEAIGPAIRRSLSYETEALLHRLDGVLPLVTQIPAVPAAAIAPAAAGAIDRFLAAGRDELRVLVHQYRRWLAQAGDGLNPAEAQRRFAMVRLRFNRVLAHFEMFADALLQRCEHHHGVLLRGLDILATDALALGAGYFEPSPVITYLDRGIGAAIRKARTRLPGGGQNPVAIIRVPRERMVGSGIGASLVHEVGHQWAASIGLVEPLRAALYARSAGANTREWTVWAHWISEIVADFWAVGVLGIGATLGLIQVVSLPRPFVFKVRLDDPHPTPWLRVHISCVIGNALYPHPQWDRLRVLWNSLYPLEADDPQIELLNGLLAHVPAFVTALLDHRPAACAGLALRNLVPAAERQPGRLAALRQIWLSKPTGLRDAAPSLAMAVLGQAKFDGVLPPGEESREHTRLLQSWALRDTIGAYAQAAARLPAGTQACGVTCFQAFQRRRDKSCHPELMTRSRKRFKSIWPSRSTLTVPTQ